MLQPGQRLADSSSSGRPPAGWIFPAGWPLVLLGLLLSVSCRREAPPAAIPATPAPDPPRIVGDWQLLYEETFDTDQTLVDGQAFGSQDWLTVALRGAGASITVQDGAALLKTDDFRDSALIGLTESLPDEYRLSVKVGQLQYEKALYEHPADFADPAFKYSWPDYIENGFYLLTISSRRVEEDSGEEFWHRYRKLVIDSNDHVGVDRGLYMIYMNPKPHPSYDRDQDEPLWVKGVPGLLCCWNGQEWNTGKWNWDVAFTYESDAWYRVEIEKSADGVIMRAFDSAGVLLPGMETTPVRLNFIYGMGNQSTEHEWAYIGEPHVDSYEGSARIDDLQLWIKHDSANDPPPDGH